MPTGEVKMVLTRRFKEIVQENIARDPVLAETLPREGIDAMPASDVDAGKAILRDYINATIGCEKLGKSTGTQSQKA